MITSKEIFQKFKMLKETDIIRPQIIEILEYLEFDLIDDNNGIILIEHPHYKISGKVFYSLNHLVMAEIHIKKLPKEIYQEWKSEAKILDRYLWRNGTAISYLTNTTINFLNNFFLGRKVLFYRIKKNIRNTVTIEWE